MGREAARVPGGEIGQPGTRPGMTNSQKPSLRMFTGTIVDIGGQLTSTLDHMRRFQAAGLSSPDALDPAVVLTELLRDVFRPLRDGFSGEELETAARVVARASELIESELFLVDPAA